MKLVYSDGYYLNFGDFHVFPVQKYQLVYRRVTEFVDPSEIVIPEPVSDEDVLRVHDFHYVQKLKTGMLSERAIQLAEVPYSPGLVDAFWLATGGTVTAGKLALERQRAVNLGGGFHHAFPDHAEGFCLINDVAIAIRSLQERKLIEHAMVIDCDVHHGNGTAFIFATDPSVFTISLHQYNNYPMIKPPSDIDVHLPDGCNDREYLERLGEVTDEGFRRMSPDLVFYLAGADPYQHDQLGGLGLTIDGLAERDRLVMNACADREVPCAIVLAGGYARNSNDTVTIHVNTIRIGLALNA